MINLVILVSLAIGACGEIDSVERYKSYFGPVECVEPDLCFNPSQFILDDLREALDYKARDDDVFIVSYPKTGSTWTKQIVTLLFNNGTIGSDDNIQDMWKLCPYLDFNMQDVKTLKRPNAIHAHLPMNYVPWNPSAKYIIVIRNPKDTAISYYFHLLKFHTRNPDFVGNLTMSVAIDAAYNKSFSIQWGNYFDWYKRASPFMDLPNVHLVVYEEMKINPVAGIRDIANFLEVSLGDDLLEAILRKSNVKHMKNITTKGFDDSFVRKGIIGDWRNHMTYEESKMIDAKTRQAFIGSKFEHMWDKFDVFDD
ncbi:Amine sulfotransferase [Halotydeus destructor]|nr:Amine sulfotransferase [Halotydeus destructor]